MIPVIDTTQMGDLQFYLRHGTCDHNSVHSCCVDDEYDFADVDVRDRLVFDIGAHIGGFGVWLATRGARVICVEPVPENAEMIRSNATLNGVWHLVTVVQAAAGKSGEQVVRFNFAALRGWNKMVSECPELGLKHDKQRRTSISHHASVGTTGGVAPVDLTYDEMTVQSLSLSELAEMFGVPDIVKIDCEGSEWSILSDPAAPLVSLLVGEWHPNESAVLRGAPQTTYSRADIDRLLGPTHDIMYSGPEGGPGGFRAEMRA